MKKTIYYLTCILFLLSLNIIPIQANNGLHTTKFIQQEYIGIVPYKDQIEEYFKEVSGVLYVKRWNATRGYWVHDWIIYVP